VPFAEIVAVITLLWLARSRAEIPHVAGCSVAVVFVVPRSRAGAIFEATPGRSVAIRELLVRAVWIGQVSDREYGTRNIVE
jgi:hypothetical protein